MADKYIGPRTLLFFLIPLQYFRRNESCVFPSGVKTTAWKERAHQITARLDACIDEFKSEERCADIYRLVPPLRNQDRYPFILQLDRIHSNEKQSSRACFEMLGKY